MLMLQIEVKSLHSPDVEVHEWQPASDAVWFLLQVEIGVRGEVGADTFDVMVATPQGLLERANADENGAVVRRATLVLRTFSWAALRKIVDSIVYECCAEDWPRSVLRLQRYFRWEFEDYVQADN
jgi:hypothetical protein